MHFKDRDPSKKIHSGRKRMGLALAGIILSPTVASCSSSDSEPIATLTSAEQSNLTDAAGDHVLELLNGDLNTGKGYLSVDKGYESRTKNSETGDPLKYVFVNDRELRASKAAGGVQVAVEHSMLDYCSDEDGIVTKGCEDDLGVGLHWIGYQATFENPDTKSLNPQKRLTKDALRRFLNDDGTTLVEVGDQYDNGVAISPDGKVYERGSVDNMDDRQEVLEALNNMANGIAD